MTVEPVRDLLHPGIPLIDYLRHVPNPLDVSDNILALVHHPEGAHVRHLLALTTPRIEIDLEIQIVDMNEVLATRVFIYYNAFCYTNYVQTGIGVRCSTSSLPVHDVSIDHYKNIEQTSRITWYRTYSHKVCLVGAVYQQLSWQSLSHAHANPRKP